MTTISVEMSDARLAARIINMAYRFNCQTHEVHVEPAEGSYAGRFVIEGEADALRRLLMAVEKVVRDDRWMDASAERKAAYS
ncbi:MAG TPA: hypothetical protein VN603_03140 [Candidatus Acidoferrales bacterium]|nr:hypothetical protein [Candidatus Acidoferrales bacterium]